MPLLLGVTLAAVKDHTNNVHREEDVAIDDSGESAPLVNMRDGINAAEPKSLLVVVDANYVVDEEQGCRTIREKLV